jgi:signal transduction histidine kinase
MKKNLHIFESIDSVSRYGSDSHTAEDGAANSHLLLEEGRSLLALSATVGAAFAGGDSLRTILQRCAEAIVQHLGAAAYIWSLDVEGKRLDMEASAGMYTPLGDIQGAVQVGESVIGFVAQERRPYVTNDICHDPMVATKAWAQGHGITSFAAYPLGVEDRLLGVMAIFARQAFTPATLQALTWMAGVIAMGIDRICISDALARSMTKVVRMNKYLRQKNVELDEFTYLASHDLQEPLRKLTVFSNLLRSDVGGELPEAAERDVAFIVDAATRMQMLVQNLVDLSQTGNGVMHCQEVALDACVDRAIAALSATVQEVDATIRRDALPVVRGDDAMLTRLYQNLLSNALKFCGDQSPVIHLTAARQGEQVVLGVMDNGIGIEREYQKQIFMPFKRLHGRGEYEGTGIGLAICRKAIKRHGGRIWVESQPGQGTHLKFTLASRWDED